MLDQSASYTSVQPALFNVVKLVEHLSEYWTIKSADRFGNTFLEILVEISLAHKAKLSVAVVEIGAVFRFHRLVAALELLLEY